MDSSQQRKPSLPSTITAHRRCARYHSFVFISCHLSWACGNCEKAERRLRGSFQAAVGIRALCGFPSAAPVSTGLLSFFCPFLLFLCLFPLFLRKISRQDRLGTTNAHSVDLQHPRVCPSFTPCY